MDAPAFKERRLVECQPLRHKRSVASSNQDRRGVKRIPFVGASEPSTALEPVKRLDTLTEMHRRIEGPALLDEAIDKIARSARWYARDIVDRLVRIQCDALATRALDPVNDPARQADHACLERGEKAHGTCTDNQHVGS